MRGRIEACVAVGLVLGWSAATLGYQEPFEFAKRADAFRLVGAVYADRTEATRQVTAEADGLHARFDSDKLPPALGWSTFEFGASYGAGQDWFGHRLRLVFRRRPFTRATRGMALNFTDPDGETFQIITHRVEEDVAAGEIVFDFAVEPFRVSGRPWGGGKKANGKMDRPLRLTGLHTHFGGMVGPGEVVLVRLEDLPPRAPDARVRAFRSTEPISVDTMYPGAEPFHGAETLTFDLEEKTYTGPVTLTLSSDSVATAAMGRRTTFTSAATNGVVSFACRLPFENLYQFLGLAGRNGKTLRPRSAKGVFRQSAAEAMRLEVETGNRFGVCRSERAGERPVVVVRNPTEKEIRWKTELVFGDALGHRFALPFDRTLAPGSAVRVAVPWPLPAKGLWKVRAALKDPDGERVLHEARFAWIEFNERTPFVAKPKFRMGIHWHSTHYLPDLVDPVIEAMVMAGAKFTRMDYGCMFSDVARADGTYDWTTTDDMVGRVRAAGLAADCIIWGAPRWAVDPAVRTAREPYGRPGCTPTRPGLFRDFCRAMGARYGTKIDYYEIGNEWDLAPARRLSPQEALALQREAYEGLHAGCPDVCVTPNGWASLKERANEDPARENPGIVQLFAAHPELYDAWVYHNHSPFPSFEHAVQATYLPLCTNKVFAAKPWVCNEAALTNHANGEPEVARTVWAKILYAWSWGSRDYIWYNLRATGWLDGSEPGYGLMTAGLRPRASYAAYAALAKIFQGLDADGRLFSEGPHQLLRFRGTKGAFAGVVLAGWEWGAATQRIVRVRTDARQAEISDHFGNRTPAAIRGGVVELPLDGNPRALLLNGATFAVSAADAETCDVLVVGGGTAGVAAALQAGRAGARTILVEQAAMVGGNMTSGGVTWPGLFHAWGRQVIGGCGWELVTNCVALAGGKLPDFSRDPGREHWRHQVRINAPLWVALAEEALAKAGVEIRYHTAPKAAQLRDGGWDVTLSAIGEEAPLRARVLIDATGNGTLAALCGGKRMRDASACQPGSFTYLINPHADESKLDWPRLEAAAVRAVKEGRLEPRDICRGVRFLIHESNVVLSNFAVGPDHGTTIANYVVGADNSTAALRTKTNLRGRAAMLRVFRFLKSQPGLEGATLVEMSPEVGVRETYRVEGDYVLTGDDYASGRLFDDSLCYAFYPIDIHTAEKGVHPKHLRRGTVATVPFRSLVVKDRPNLLVVGRCVSSDRAANSALRVQATCMATGQVAGEAASLASRRKCDVRQVPLTELKARLRSSGAIVPE